MSRKAFKIVNNLDLSGNSIIDVREIYRGDYEDPIVRSLTLRAGSDPAGGAAATGGNLNIYSGYGVTAPGAVNIFIPEAANTYTNKYGIELLGSTALNIKTNNQQITISSGTAGTVFSSTVNSTSSSTGSVRLAGGAYIARNLIVDGDLFTTNTTFNLLNSTATTINAFGNATTIEIGRVDATTVINFNTTRDAVSVSDAGVLVDGGLSVAMSAYIGGNLNVLGNTTLGNAATDTTSIRGLVTLSDSSQTYSLRLGADVDLYRSAANVLTIGDSVTLGGQELQGPSTFNIGSTSTTINISSVGNQTTVLGNMTIQGTVPYLKLLPAANPPVTPERGLLYFNNQTDAIEYFPRASSDVSISLGQETVVLVRNTSGALIPNGAVVRFAGGSTGTTPHVALAQADSAANAMVVGVATEDIADNATGFMTTQGVVHDTAPSGFPAGSLLYLSATTPGGVTNTPPAAPNYVVRIGAVLETQATTDNIAVLIGQSWSTTSTFNGLRAADFAALNSLILPLSSTPSQTANGSVAWDSDNFLLTVGTGTGRKTIVDLDSTQGLTNKTYNGLTVAANGVGYIISGGATSRSFTLATDLTINTGAVTLSGNAAGSTVILPGGTLTIDSLSSGQALYSSAAGQISSEAQLAVSRGGTGIGAFVAGDLLYASDTTTLSRLAKGTAWQVLTMNELATGPVYRNIVGSGDIIISNDGDNLTIATSQSVSPESNVTFSSLTLAGDLAVNGGDITTTADTFNLLGNVSTLNMLISTSATINYGTDVANTRTVNFNASAVNFGSATNSTVVNQYGPINFGGPTGIQVVWNGTTNSLDFVKL